MPTLLKPGRLAAATSLARTRSLNPNGEGADF
jgi:hypothetical protein